MRGVALDASEARELAHLGPLATECVTLPRSGKRYEITRPTDLDLLLDLVQNDPEQNLPYWSEIWPSGIALADAILATPEVVRDREVLELGAGLGISAIAALEAGARLIATDYAVDALTLCRLNTVRNTGRAPDLFRANWRVLEALDRCCRGGVPVVLATDVLYEARDVAPLLALLPRLIAPNGVFWLAEPGRPTAQTFLEATEAAGWRRTTIRHDGPWPDPKDAGVVVHVHSLQKMTE